MNLKELAMETNMIYFSLYKVIEVLQKAFDTMDNRLEGHGERVAYITWKTLEKSKNYDEETIINLVILAFFHDIGAYKTNKLENLLDFEMHNYHNHAVYGYLFLKYLSPLKVDIDVILYHHLKFKDLTKLDKKDKEKSIIINFANRLDILIRSEMKITPETINSLTNCIVENNEIPNLIEGDNILRLCENITSGEYKKELEDYFNAYYLEEKYLIEFLRMLVFIIDFRSPQTVTHSIYVWLISELICDLLEIEADKKEEITLAALFHDVGKLATPIDILEKKSKLTFEEMKIMKCHVVESKKIVEGLGLSKIANILGMHHEKLDGSGYPDGISGDDIPFEARIIMVVDIFSALIGERSYKRPYEKEEVVNILNKLVISNKIDESIVKVIVDNFDYLMNNSKEKVEKFIKIYDVINKEYELILQEQILKE